LTGYLVRRAWINVAGVWSVSTLVFFAPSLGPGDFVAQRLAGQTVTSSDPAVLKAQLDFTRHEFGLDKPVYIQYLRFLKKLVIHQSLGRSFATRRDVNSIVAAAAARIVRRRRFIGR